MTKEKYLVGRIAPFLGVLGLIARPGVAPAEVGIDARITAIEAAAKSAQSAGDNAWMLTSAALVLMMTGPGLALFYGGLVRRKNTLAIMMQSFAMMGMITVLWGLFGYSLAFAEARRSSATCAI